MALEHFNIFTRSTLKQGFFYDSKVTGVTPIMTQIEMTQKREKRERKRAEEEKRLVIHTSFKLPALEQTRSDVSTEEHRFRCYHAV